MIGKEYRKVPTILYGVYDDFLKVLRINYTQIFIVVPMWEPPVKLGVHIKYYVGVTFKTLMDMW